MQRLYIQKNQENQKRTEKGLNLLNLLFGAGILADLAGVIMIALSMHVGDFTSVILNSIIAIIISGILATTIIFNIYMKIKAKEVSIGKAVDAVVEDGKGNLVLIYRRE
jgi:hypothetical protein